MTEQMSMADLVAKTKSAYGMTWAEMGRQMGRSERMMRKIARGETSGESYRTSLTELYTRGQVETLTPRRRGKDGTLARVRSKRGATAKSVTPTDTRGRRAPTAPRGRFSVTTRHMAAGGRLDQVEMPKTARSQGRTKGWNAVKDALYRTTAAASQRHGDKRVAFTVTYQDPDGTRRQVPVGQKGGYHASDVVSDIRTKHGGDVESWVSSQASGVYSDMAKGSIVGVQMNTSDATRSKDQRRAEDAAGTRRGKGWKR
ncbi:MAG: hypothetical protein Q4G40_10570 [Brachybacterium sp.]|nr:hypothetical protein [Brachybacterium sp.]